MQKVNLEDFDLLMNNLTKKMKVEALIKKGSSSLDRSFPYVHQVKENMAYVRSPALHWKNNSIVHLNDSQRGLILALQENEAAVLLLDDY